MSRVLVVLFSILLGTLACSAKAKPDGVAGVREVVTRQLEAMRKNEMESAYGFAHSGIKAQFTQAEFERMVRRGFPSMLRPGKRLFGAAVEEDGEAAIEVTLLGEDGETTSYRYQLELEDGKWRITGVIPIEPSEADVPV